VQPADLPDVDSASRSAPIQAASIAVLPFTDMSPEKDQEYFTDGLAEELLNVLAQIPDLKVAGRTSSFQFKGRNEDLREIGEQLGVANILEGSVRKAGGQIRITAQLISAADGYHRWSQNYDRTLEDIFAIQDDIAAAVASALQVTLLGDVQDDSPATDKNFEAYNAFLQGGHFLSLGGSANLAKAMKYYEQALELDPEYAAAWSGIASVSMNQSYSGYVRSQEGFPLARQAATRAIELDKNLAAGWINLANVLYHYDWKWAEAEEALRNARVLAPNDATSFTSSSTLSSALGHSDDAIGFARRAVEIDPLNTFAHYRLGFALMLAGRLQDAETSFLKVTELQPDRVRGHLSLGLIELLRSRPEAALAEMRQETELWAKYYGLALAYHALGRREESDAALLALKKQEGDAAAIQIAEVYAYRGEPDDAFTWLERAREAHDPGIVWLKTSPLLSSLRGDVRWPTLLGTLGLPI
jgi:TolB-like protein/Flp pilus assembly protein TadD